jgi:hypothetical protein
MSKSPAVRLYILAAIAAATLAVARPASAQFTPQPLNGPPTGETYHIEASADLWFPSADVVFSSGGSGALSGIAGTTIDAKRDLGLTDQRFPKIAVTLRPTRGQKLRFAYIPINYEQSATPKVNIVFNGISFPVTIPVNSTLDWKAYRFAYEYDFLVKNHGFAGFIVEAKYTDVQVNLTEPGAAQFAHAQAPIPALGGIGRYYVVPNVSITAEVTGFKLPTIEDRYSGHYVDVDIYGTANFTRNIGVQGGYRSLDLGYLVKQDSGSFVLQGIYIGAVVRY